MAAAKSIAGKNLFNQAFNRATPIEVPAPELGKGVVVRFKSEWTVDDVISVVSVPDWKEPVIFELILARVSMLDADGKPMVEDGKDEWFQRGTNGVLLGALARRAKLPDRFCEMFRSSDPGAKPLDQKDFTRVVYDLSVAMKLAPASIRKWAAKDLLNVLESASPPAEG